MGRPKGEEGGRLEEGGVNGRHGQTGEGNIKKGSESTAYILYIYSIYTAQINKKNTKIIHPRSK